MSDENELKSTADEAVSKTTDAVSAAASTAADGISGAIDAATGSVQSTIASGADLGRSLSGRVAESYRANPVATILAAGAVVAVTVTVVVAAFRGRR